MTTKHQPGEDSAAEPRLVTSYEQTDKPPSERWLLRSGIAKHGLTTNQYAVLRVISDRWNVSTGVAYPSQKGTADALNLTRPTVRAATEALEKTGLVVMHERGRQGRETRWCFHRACQLSRQAKDVQPVKPTGQVRETQPVMPLAQKRLAVEQPVASLAERSAPARGSAAQALRAAAEEERTKTIEKDMQSTAYVGGELDDLLTRASARVESVVRAVEGASALAKPFTRN